MNRSTRNMQESVSIRLVFAFRLWNVRLSFLIVERVHEEWSLDRWAREHPGRPGQGTLSAQGRDQVERMAEEMLHGQ